MSINEAVAVELIRQLRLFAKAAPPGPWKVYASSGYGNPTVRGVDGPIFSTGNSRRPHKEAQAACAYVAATNPDMILDLCDAFEAALVERKALMEAIDRLAASVGA